MLSTLKHDVLKPVRLAFSKLCNQCSIKGACARHKFSGLYLDVGNFKASESSVCSYL